MSPPPVPPRANCRLATSVPPGSPLGVRIDGYLTYLWDEWEEVPHLAQEWDEWDELSRLSFVVDWPIREDRLQQLQQWAGQTASPRNSAAATTICWHW